MVLTEHGLAMMVGIFLVTGLIEMSLVGLAQWLLSQFAGITGREAQHGTLGIMSVILALVILVCWPLGLVVIAWPLVPLLLFSLCFYWGSM